MVAIDPGLRAVIRQLVSGETAWPLFLHGPPGLGKTCAALALLDHAGGHYFTVAGLCEQLVAAANGRLTWNKEGRGGEIFPERLWQQIHASPLVVLDEIGCRDKVTDFQYEVTKRLVDEREFRAMVAISNLGLSRLEQLYDARLVSRLARGKVVQLAGSDRRLA